jgi:hypothetical protein
MAHDLTGDLLDERAGERPAQRVPYERAVEHSVDDLCGRPGAEHGVDSRERGSLHGAPAEPHRADGGTEHDGGHGLREAHENIIDPTQAPGKRRANSTGRGRTIQGVRKRR